MTDFVTPYKGLTEPTVGADNNTWGGLLNTDLSLVDTALGGTLSLSVSGNTTLTSTQAQNTGYEFSGTITSAATITWPAFFGFAAVKNGTTGNQALSCGISGGAFVTVSVGETAAIWSDGTNFIRLTGTNLPPAPNLLINPSMEISQQFEGGSTTNGYAVDMWNSAINTSSGSPVFSVARSTDAPAGFANSVKFTMTTGESSVGAGDYALIYQPLEANNITALGLGTSSAATVTLSFWQRCSISSYVFSTAFANYGVSRSYVINFTSNSAANTWAKYTATFTLDTGGTWVTGGNAGGAYLYFALAAGSTYQTTANNWSGGEFWGSSANTNTILTTSGATFEITGVKLEASAIPTPFVRRPIGEEFALCQRYYQKSYDLGTAPGAAASAGQVLWTAANSDGFITILLKQTMRADPTVTAFSPVTGTSGKIYDVSGAADVNDSVNSQGENSFIMFPTSGATSGHEYRVHYAADARL